MIVIHKPFDRICGTGRAKRARVLDLTEKDPNPNYRRIRRDKLPRKGEYLTVDHTGYVLVRGKSEWVRVLPEEQEKEYREILAEIARLRQRASDVVEEGWVRAEPYVHPEPANVVEQPKVDPETRRDLDRLGRELGKIFQR